MYRLDVPCAVDTRETTSFSLSSLLKSTKISCFCAQVGRSMCGGHEADASLCGRGVRALYGGLPQTNLPEQVSLTA